MVQVAIAVGVAIASRILISLLTPTQEVKNKPQKIRGPKTTFDQPIPKVYGRVRLNSSYIWARKVTVTQVEVEAEGGKGGGGRSGEKNVYSADYAVLFCEGPVRFRKIWINGKLVYRNDNPGAQDGVVREEETKDIKLKGAFFHQGGWNQPRDSLIEGFEGTQNTPAFLGKAYITINQHDLEDVGNAFPSAIEAEVEAVEFTQPSLGAILRDVCLQAGLKPEQIDVSDVQDISVRGAILKRDGGTYAEFIKELQGVYFFLAVEDRGVMRFVKQRRAGTVATLTQGDLAATTERSAIERYERRRTPEVELPTEVSVSYYNCNNDYERGNQYSRRADNTHVNKYKHETELSLNDSEAATAAKRMRLQFWLARQRFEKINLLPAYLGLAPGDAIDLPTPSVLQPVQIKALNIGANLMVEIQEALLYEYAALEVSEEVEQPYRRRQKIYEYQPGDAKLTILDMPLVGENDTELGVYAALSSTSGRWRGGAVFVSRDGNAAYRSAKGIARLSTTGSCSNAEILNRFPNNLSDAPIIDTDTQLKITLEHGTLNPVPQAAFERLENLLLIGSEYVAFKNATLIGVKEYQVSHLRRGCQGTEWAMDEHSSPEPVVLVKGNGAYLMRLPGKSEDIGRNINFKPVPAGMAPEETDSSSQTTIVGRALYPLAPINISGEVDPVGSLKITWTTRNRGALNRAGEEKERYEIDILNSQGEVVRTLSSTAPKVVYANTDRNTDGLATDLGVVVYKMSAIVGRGFPGKAEPLTIGSTAQKLARNEAEELRDSLSALSTLPEADKLSIDAIQVGFAAFLNRSQIFTRAQSVLALSVTDVPSIAIDAQLSNTFDVTLTGNRSFQNPTNLTNGQTLILRLRQDSVGSREVTWSNAFLFGISGPPQLSVEPNLTDVLTFSCTADKLLFCGIQYGFEL